MSSHPIQDKIITIDTYSDYIPLASTATNIISLVMKMALGIFELIDQNFRNEIFKNPLYKYCVDKSAVDCVFLSIPIFNILWSLARDQRNKIKKAESRLQSLQIESVRLDDELIQLLDEAQVQHNLVSTRLLEQKDIAEKQKNKINQLKSQLETL